VIQSKSLNASTIAKIANIYNIKKETEVSFLFLEII